MPRSEEEAMDVLQAVWSADCILTATRRAVVTVLVLCDLDGRPDPSIETIAAMSGLSPRTCQKLLADLESYGWLTRERRSSPCGANLTSAYRVTVPGAR